MNAPKTLLLFDIDSTLLRADDATRQAINRTFAELYGLKDPRQNVPFSGRTDLGIFKDVAVALLGRPFLPGELQRVTGRYLENLPAELDRRVFRLMPGVGELLPLLDSRKDVVLGLETGNLEPAAYMKLQRGGIERYFSLGGFGSDSEERSEFIKMAITRARNLDHVLIPDENIWVIGDSPHDIAAGNAAGVKTIAVATGSARRNTLMAQSPTLFLSDLSNTAAFLKHIGLK
ncbi:MAG TPA: HAD hydrolase-like protein [Dehalococcoidales bacterium]|nr:HAD hydrolase-like protein [Dehalococcoidales bacterium]